MGMVSREILPSSHNDDMMFHKRSTTDIKHKIVQVYDEHSMSLTHQIPGCMKAGDSSQYYQVKKLQSST